MGALPVATIWRFDPSISPSHASVYEVHREQGRRNVLPYAQHTRNASDGTQSDGETAQIWTRLTGEQVGK